MGALGPIVAVAIQLGVASGQADGSDPMVEDLVGRFRSRVGEVVGAGLSITSARAEGRTVVVGIEMPEASRRIFSPRQVTAMLAFGMCTRPEGVTFFTEGRSLRVDVAAGASAPPGASIDRCPDPAEAQPTAANFAAGVQAFAGRRLEGGLVLRGARADENVVIVSIEGPRGWTQIMSTGEMASAFLGGFCRDPRARDFFAGGGRFRLEAFEGGRVARRGDLIDRCPA